MFKTYPEKDKKGKRTGKIIATIAKGQVIAKGDSVKEAKQNLVNEIRKYLLWNGEDYFLKVFQHNNLTYILRKKFDPNIYEYVGYIGNQRGPQCLFMAESEQEAIEITERSFRQYIEV